MVIVLSIGTRIIGVALIPCAFIIEYLRHKKLNKPALASAFPLVVVVLLLFVTGFSFVSRYLEQFSINPASIFKNAFNYLKIMGSLWNNEHSRMFQYLVYLMSIGLAGIGYLRRVKTKLTALELFPLIYFLCLIFWPGYISFRGMMPIVPLFIFYALTGARAIRMFLRNPAVRFPLILFIVFILLSYTGYYSQMNLDPLPEGIGKKESLELFRFIKENTQKKDIIIFRKPRALALFTGRKASVYYRADGEQELWDYFYRIKANYVITGKPFWADYAYLRPLLARYPDRVQPVYANADFEVFRITSEP